MGVPHVSGRLVLALAVPAALAETLVNIYNVYVPLYLQAGGPSLSALSGGLPQGFSLGATAVGLWLTADNVLSFFLQPLAGAWSDRLRTRLGRRLPIVLATLPLIVVGYAGIPLGPAWLRSGWRGRPAPAGPSTGSAPSASDGPWLLALLAASCTVFYLGYLPARAMFQTLRQETVASDDRAKLEAWYFVLFGGLTTLALTAGGVLYRIYAPLLFWVAAGLYALSVAFLLLAFRERADLMASASRQEPNPLNQLRAVFCDRSSGSAATFGLFLASVMCYAAALSGVMNFGSSWLVSVVAVSETQAASMMGLATLGSTLVALPAGYLASAILGRRGLYLASQVVALSAMLLALLAPGWSTGIFVLLGFGLGGALVAQLPLAAELLRRPGAMGAAVGLYNLAYMVGGMLGSFAAGRAVEATSYRSLFAVTALFAMLSIACIILSRDRPAAARLAHEQVK